MLFAARYFVDSRAFLVALILPQLVMTRIACGADISHAESPIEARPDGSIVTRIKALSSTVQGTERHEEMVFEFGLPAVRPSRQWQEDAHVPVCQSQWHKDGIRYTEKVLLTRLAPGGLLLDGQPPSDSVLLLQITGENLTNEYTEATAAFSLKVGSKPLDLELRGDLVYVILKGLAVPLGSIDVSPSGVLCTNGPQLRFRGHMPPGSSGAMTIKIPFSKVQEEADFNRVRDLEFEDELTRMKRFWTEHTKTHPKPLFPIKFSQ